MSGSLSDFDFNLAQPVSQATSGGLSNFAFDLSNAPPLTMQPGALGGNGGGGVNWGGLAGALKDASKSGLGQQQQGQPQMAPGAGGSPTGRGNPGALQTLMQMLMQRQQAYQQAAQAGPSGGQIVPQTARINQPGLLGI